MSVAVNEIVKLSPGEDGQYGTADDTNDGWILVESKITEGISGYVPEAYLEKIEPSPEPSSPEPVAPRTSKYQKDERQSSTITEDVPADNVSVSSNTQSPRFSQTAQAVTTGEEPSAISVQAHDVIADGQRSSIASNFISSSVRNANTSSAHSSIDSPRRSTFTNNSPGTADPPDVDSNGSPPSRTGVSQMANSASLSSSIRRLSDPRLPTHLLNLMDPQAKTGATYGGNTSLFQRSKTPQSLASSLRSAAALSGPAKSLPLAASAIYAKSKASTAGGAEQDSRKLFSSVRQLDVSGLQSTIRVPAMVAAVNAEQYDEVISKSEAYHKNLDKVRGETFKQLTDMSAVLSGRITNHNKQCASTLDKIEMLNRLVEDEKLSWTRKIEDERIQGSHRFPNNEVPSSAAVTA